MSGIELGGTCRLADVLIVRLGNTIDDVGVEEVVGVCHLGTSAEDNSRELHSDPAVILLLK